MVGFGDRASGGSRVWIASPDGFMRLLADGDSWCSVVRDGEFGGGVD